MAGGMSNRMQLKPSIFVLDITRYFPAPGVFSLASPRNLCNIPSVLGLRGTGGSSQACVLTVPPPQTAPVTRGDAADPSEKVRKKSPTSRTFCANGGSHATRKRGWWCCKQRRSDTDKSVRIPDFFNGCVTVVGEFNLPFHPGASVDSPVCSPKKKSPPSNPCWSAHGPQPAWHATNAMRSTLGTWCNSGQGPTRTGRQAYCWSVRCATTAASAALCCVPTGAAIARHGTRTASPRSCASVEPRFRLLVSRSARPATLRTALNAWEGTAGSEPSIRYRNLTPTVPNDYWLAGSRPDNEYHAALCRSP